MPTHRGRLSFPPVDVSCTVYFIVRLTELGGGCSSLLRALSRTLSGVSFCAPTFSPVSRCRIPRPLAFFSIEYLPGVCLSRSLFPTKTGQGLVDQDGGGEVFLSSRDRVFVLPSGLLRHPRRLLIRSRRLVSLSYW